MYSLHATQPLAQCQSICMQRPVPGLICDLHFEQHRQATSAAQQCRRHQDLSSGQAVFTVFARVCRMCHAPDHAVSDCTVDSTQSVTCWWDALAGLPCAALCPGLSADSAPWLSRPENMHCALIACGTLRSVSLYECHLVT